MHTRFNDVLIALDLGCVVPIDRATLEAARSVRATRTSRTLRSNAFSRMTRQLGAARFTSEMGCYLPVNILDGGRSVRWVRVCAEFQSIGLATDLNSYIWTNPA